MREFLEKAKRLEEDYADRKMQIGTREKAKWLACGAFDLLNKKPIRELKAEDFRALSIICEVLDYFNVLDSELGTETRRYKSGRIYDWLLGLSHNTAKNLSGIRHRRPHTVNPKQLDAQEAVRILEQSRFVCAVGLNEEYRWHKKPLSPATRQGDADTQLREMIRYVEKELEPDQFKRQPMGYLERFHDNLALMYFILAKRQRQSVCYADSEVAMYQASNHLVRLAMCHSIAGKKASGDYGATACRNIHRAMLRLGVVDLARAWLYLYWGRISKTEAAVARALHLIGPNDELNYLLGRSIQGTIKRIRAGSSTEELSKAKQQLQGVYESLTKGGVPVPRYAVRTLYELVLALIIAGELDLALKHLETIGSSSSPNPIGGVDPLKMLRNLSWAIQIRTLLSLIARKNARRELLRNSPSSMQDDGSEGGKNIRKEVSDISSRLIVIINSLILPEGFHRERFQAGHDQNKSLDIAEHCASIAVKLAGSFLHLRIHKIDALIALGEVYMDKEDYEEAAKQFDACLRILESVRAENPDPPGNEYVSICRLYLLQIAVKQARRKRAKKLLAEYGKLPKVEHRWILDQETVIKAEALELINSGIIIRFGPESDSDFLEDSLWIGVEDKMRDGKTDEELARDLNLGVDALKSRLLKAKKRFGRQIRRGRRPNKPRGRTKGKVVDTA